MPTLTLMRQIFYLWVFGFIFFIGVAQAQEIPSLDFFHGAECPHCHEEKKWFSTLKQMYPDLQINEYEVWHDVKNQALWQTRLKTLGKTPRAVPTNIIKDEVIVGFNPEAILATMQKHFGDPSIPLEAVQVVLPTKKDFDAKKWGILLLLAGAIIGGALWMGKQKN